MKVREALVPVVDDQECTVKINSVTEKLFILPASSFCAGGDDGNDACQGDGGSGLTCEIDGYYELTGLVSWGMSIKQCIDGIKKGFLILTYYYNIILIKDKSFIKSTQTSHKTFSNAEMRREILCLRIFKN